MLYLEAEFGMSVYNLSEIWQESSAEYNARIWHQNEAVNGVESVPQDSLFTTLMVITMIAEKANTRIKANIPITPP